MINHSTPRYIPKEIKVYVHIKTCLQMFISALLVVVKAGNKPSVHQQGIDKQMLIHPYKEITTLQ